MNAPRLLGMETEYALARHEPLPAWSPSRVADALIPVLQVSGHPWLPDEHGGRGAFLASGARFYIDRGSHPEYATPECDNPWDVVGHARAGELLLLELLVLADQVTPSAPGTVVLRSAVDYGRRGATWGCHESYLHRADPMILPDQLVPHLVSRVVFAGAGGFKPVGPGLEFTLSPRAWMLTHDVSPHTTGDRGIYHTKDETLSGAGWHRMHVIAGESLCSDLASVLKLGTTALVLAAVEAGRRPGHEVRLAAPLEALRLYASDPACQGRAPLRDGRRISALAIQRLYLGHVESCLGDTRLPEWAPDLCSAWRRVLDGLERGDREILRALDWPLKLEIYREHARRLGFDWERLPAWTSAMHSLERAAVRVTRDGDTWRTARLGHPFIWRELRRLSPVLHRAGFAWSDTESFARLRHQLLEADLRFGQVGPHGIYQQLAARGLLPPGAGRAIPDPRGLVDQPPPGRARVRGETVRTVWQRGEAHRYRAGWSSVTEVATGRVLDLSDPHGAAASWVGPAEVAAMVAQVAAAGR